MEPNISSFDLKDAKNIQMIGYNSMTPITNMTK